MPECIICNKEFKFLNNTHLKKHGLTCEQYKIKYGIESLTDDDLKYDRMKYMRGKTYEELYGSEMADELKENRSIHTTNQMKDPNQITIRKNKCGEWANDREEYELRIASMKASYQKDPTITERRKKTLYENYNNGSNMTPRFSKMAYDYIIKFLKDNNIPENLCYFANGGINNKEYFQRINGNIRFYDLVVLNEKTKEIDIILEYNGPFHYRLNEVIEDPEGPNTWYSSCKTTKLESYNIDMEKIVHAKLISNNVYVYWLDNDVFDIIEG